MEEKAQELSELFKLLSNPNRLLILCALLEKPLCVSDLAEHIGGISMSALSQHLHALKAEKLISDEKNGQYVTYRLADERIRILFEVVKEQYCS